MKAGSKDQRKQLNVELQRQHISSENLQSPANNDAIVPTPIWTVISSSHENTKNDSDSHVYSENRNMKPNQRPMSCKPRNIPAKRGFQQQRISSSNESLSGPEMTGNRITGIKEKATAVAWPEKDNQTDEISREINDFLPGKQRTQRIFQKRDQKEKFLFDNGVDEGETQLFHASAFPARRMTMSLQHRTSVKGKKYQVTPTSSPKSNQPQGEMSRESHKCIIPATSTESTVYDSIDTERLLRLNLSDPVLMSDLQEELISRHAGENRKYMSTMAPPSSPRVASPTPQANSTAQQRTYNSETSTKEHSDINRNTAKVNERHVISSPKTNSLINFCDVPTVSSSFQSSSIDTQNSEEKVPQNNRKDNSGWVQSVDEGIVDREPMSDVRVRSVQLLCTHSGRLRHTATLIETYPVTFPTKYPTSEKEGTKNLTMTPNKVFVSKSNYKPIKMVYEENGHCKSQEMGIPVPHLHRYLSNLQKKQMKMGRGMTPQGAASSLPLSDGIYKTIKTYEFGPEGPQETVQKTLICKNATADRRPKTSNSTPVANKSLWKSRPQSGPSRFLTNNNIGRKSPSTKVWGGDKQIKKKTNQNSDGKESKQHKVISNQQNFLEEDDSQVSMETQPNQMVPRVHFESKLKNKNVPLNSILKKNSQETASNQLANSSESDPKEKASTLNTLNNNSTCKPQNNILENCEKQSNKTTVDVHLEPSDFKISEKFHTPKFNKNSPNKSYESNKGTENQTGILFNGIGASSDFCHVKDVSLREIQKPLEEEPNEIPVSTNNDLDTAVNVFNKSDKEEKKRVSFQQKESDSFLSTLPLHTVNSSDKDNFFTKERDKNNSSSLFEESEKPVMAEKTEKESDYYLTTTKYIQTDKKETSSNTSPTSKDYMNRRLPGNFRSTATDLSSQPSALNASQTKVKTETQPQPTKAKSERKSGPSKKTKLGKGRNRSKSTKFTGPPVYLTSVQSQNPTDEDDFECEKLSEKLMENGVYVSWKTIRGGLYPPTGRSLHYEIADTGLLPPSDLLSHPKNWFPKEYKELQQATKNLERAELALWKQKRAEEKKFGSKRKKKITKKKKK